MPLNNPFRRRAPIGRLLPALKSNLRSMAPMLLALTFVAAAHAQGTIDFSGADTVMGSFKTFAIYAGAIMPYLGGNPNDGRAFYRRHTSIIRCSVRCRCPRLGRRLDWLTYGADASIGGPMLTTKRGEPLRINPALNKPRTKLGLDLPTWMSIVFVSATVFLVGLRLVASLTFAALTAAAWVIVRKHPKMFQLWFLRWQQKAYYDPRKQD